MVPTHRCLELPPAVVGDPDGVEPHLARALRIIRPDYALKGDRAIPLGTEPRGILPVKGLRGDGRLESDRLEIRVPRFAPGESN